MNQPISNDAQAGVVFGYALDGKGGGQLLDGARAANDGELLWFHVHCDAPNATTWFAAQGLEESVINMLIATETRPRTLQFDDALLFFLRGVNTTPNADPEDMASLRVWLAPGLIITARKQARRLQSVDDIRQLVAEGRGPASAGEFVPMLVERLADRIGYFVDAIEAELETTEVELAGEHFATLRHQLASARRKTAEVRRYLSPQRDALETAARLRGCLSVNDVFALREQSERTMRYVEDLDLAREHALVLQEELQNRHAEQQNARMYVLSLVAAVFLPLSFLTGVFGMNLAGMPGLENPHSFKYMLIGMGISAVAMLAFMRWRRWL